MSNPTPNQVLNLSLLGRTLKNLEDKLAKIRGML